MATAMWHEVSGDGPALLVLHPGGTDSRAMGPLCAQLDGYRLIVVDLPGHGRSPDVAADWHFADLADAAADVLRDVLADAPSGPDAASAHVVGWSDGAIVGLHLALRHPALVRSLVFGAGVFRRDGWLDGVLDGEPPQFMADSYGEVSPDGVEHWPSVVAKSAALHRAEPEIGAQELAALTAPALVVVGDDDEVRLEHAVEFYRLLPDGELAVLPRATHGAVVEKPELLARLIRDFHAEPRSNGVAPIRRAG